MSRHPRPPPSAGARAIAVPTRKISETLLDFAAPVLAEYPPPAPLAVVRAVLQFAITVWNAHVMTLPVWNHPEPLAQLRQLADRPDAPPPMKGWLDRLTQRRRHTFAEDPRAVGEWSVTSDGAGGFRFRCDARLPPDVQPIMDNR
jgi:hypothetical protein